MATTENKHKRNMFNEATRVQMPALVHLTRLGYKYIGKMTEDMAGSVYDPDTNILINVFKEQFAYGHLGTVRDAKVPYAPISPDNTKNTILGLALGLIASCVISILLELIDTTIKADDDLQQIYGLPVFAEIPDFETQSR